jgi:PleD family two-component response regulator
MRSTPHTDRPPRRILVIDDDESALQAITSLLATAGYDVRGLRTPVGAADAAELDPSILAVVVDLDLPVLRGDNIARVFQSRALLRHLPFVLLSSGEAQATLESLRKALPRVQVVPKSQLASGLVPAVDAAIDASLTRRVGRDDD